MGRFFISQMDDLKRLLGAAATSAAVSADQEMEGLANAFEQAAAGVERMRMDLDRERQNRAEAEARLARFSKEPKEGNCQVWFWNAAPVLSPPELAPLVSRRS